MNALRSFNIMLMALVVMAASVCLCTFKVAAPGMAMAAHAHHMQTASAIQADMPAPCDKADKPCHVVAVADVPQAADVKAPVASVFVLAAPAQITWSRAHFTNAPQGEYARWRLPPPTPVAAQDRHLT